MTENRRVAVVGGSGALGFGLALRLALAGQGTVIGSREKERACSAAAEINQLAESDLVTGEANSEAVKGSETVFLTVPFAAQIPTLRGIVEDMSQGAVLVDATAPLETAVGGKPTRPLYLWPGSAALQARELVPDGVEVVSALQTVSAKTLRDLDHSIDENVLVCGDSADAKKRVALLLAQIDGLRPINCGQLAMARITEQLTPLLIGINKRYKTTHAGLGITSLPEKLW